LFNSQKFTLVWAKPIVFQPNMGRTQTFSQKQILLDLIRDYKNAFTADFKAVVIKIAQKYLSQDDLSEFIAQTGVKL